MKITRNDEGFNPAKGVMQKTVFDFDVVVKLKQIKKAFS
jgi:hypothetical protein